MPAEWQWLEAVTQEPMVAGAARAALVLLVAMAISRTVGRTLERLLERDDIDAQRAMLLRRAVSYTVYGVAALMIVRELGVDLRVLLGAAGVLSVAIGFASQTSASNLISGLFLIAERPFAVGDIVQIGATTGTVLSIDLLSIKLRTFDNLLVRVPNESVLKTEVTNMTRFPIRRYDLHLTVALDADLERVETVLLALADALPECLIEPKAGVFVESFGDAGVHLRFSVWAAKDRFLTVRRTLPVRTKRALDAAGIALGRQERRIAGPIRVSWESVASDGATGGSTPAPTKQETP